MIQLMLDFPPCTSKIIAQLDGSNFPILAELKKLRKDGPIWHSESTRKAQCIKGEIEKKILKKVIANHFHIVAK